ncbi:hypothetical protein F5Y17DRAFT_160049 [Xylariaceae sp. FL0594]|nr:hypothetical protein F5Y17DRAFT_160049 [Xylariaceae sp. FL0594]
MMGAFPSLLLLHIMLFCPGLRWRDVSEPVVPTKQYGHLIGRCRGRPWMNPLYSMPCPVGLGKGVCVHVFV